MYVSLQYMFIQYKRVYIFFPLRPTKQTLVSTVASPIAPVSVSNCYTNKLSYKIDTKRY